MESRNEQVRAAFYFLFLMNYKKLINILGTMLLFIGFVLAFLPHAFHHKIGLNDNTPHLRHVVYGIILVIISLGILVYNNKALRFQK